VVAQTSRNIILNPVPIQCIISLLRKEKAMLNKREIVREWIRAKRDQDIRDEKLHQVFQLLHPDNYVCSGDSHLLEAYTSLVKKVVGKQRWPWIEWWVYEANYGKYSMEFALEGDVYDAQQLTFDQFWQIITRFYRENS
jgi:hypothetical protein